MGFFYVIFAVAILVVIFAILLSIITIWFRNKGMRIISFIFAVLAFAFYLVLFFTIGNADEFYGISIDKLLFLLTAIPLFLQCFFAMQSAVQSVTKKIFFSLAFFIIVRLFNVIIVAIADLVYKNSLENVGQLTHKISTYALVPLILAGISFVFASLFHPNIKSFKELATKTFTILAAIILCDELLNILMIYTKYHSFLIYDWYTYLIILGVSLFQVVVGLMLGLYLFRSKQDNFSA